MDAYKAAVRHIQYQGRSVRLKGFVWEQQRISALTVSEVQRPGVRDWLDVGVQRKADCTEVETGQDLS